MLVGNKYNALVGGATSKHRGGASSNQQTRRVELWRAATLGHRQDHRDVLERVQLVGPGAQEDGLAVVGGSEQQQDFFQRGEHRRLIRGRPPSPEKPPWSL